jgi:hypothetical protein
MACDRWSWAIEVKGERQVEDTRTQGGLTLLDARRKVDSEVHHHLHAFRQRINLDSSGNDLCKIVSVDLTSFNGTYIDRLSSRQQRPLRNGFFSPRRRESVPLLRAREHLLVGLGERRCVFGATSEQAKVR